MANERNECESLRMVFTFEEQQCLGRGSRWGGTWGPDHALVFDQVSGMGVCSPAVIHQPTS